jgi:circadian clock protein KaiB
MEKHGDTLKKAKKTVRRDSGGKYILKLYVAGITPRSTKAILNIKQICREHLEGRYELEIIDIYQQPVLARGEQIVAIPTLIKKLPPPLRKFIGDMSDTEKILVGFDLIPRADKEAE